MAGAMTLDKRLSVGNIITIATVIVGGIFTYAQMHARVDMLQADLARVTTEVEKRADQWDDVQSRLIRVEEKLANQNELLRQIRDTMATRARP